MRACSYSDLRQHLRERLDEVHETRVPMLVTRRNGPDSVIIDKDEYDALMETLHLLRSPANAARLMRSAAAADAGNLTAHPLADDDA